MSTRSAVMDLTCERYSTRKRPACSAAATRGAVLVLGATERFAAVGQRHGGAILISDAARRFQGAVAATHHQHMLAAVLFGIDQAIHDFGQFFAGHIERARRAAPADGEQQGAGLV